jgi:hypothetical protein
VKRGLLGQNFRLSPELVFALVRDMPYQRASSREPEATIREWRGTCSGKHYLLKVLFEELGFEAHIVMCPHVFTEENTAHFPAHLKALVSNQPNPDVHTFIRLKSNDQWMDIDATWPLSTRYLGMPVNDQFQPGVNMRIACEPVEFFEVPDGIDPQTFKERLIKAYCSSQSYERDRFVEEMGRWLLASAS